uniref:NADH dehydrogenase subunit 6 n=1 Tax=Iassus lateralis TaxID=3054420 RepID=A0AA49X8D9_9HEMI|nr:NADH dehydrogenase subunit 6 [Iassus lateralis]WIW75753.1 NADH dehydrogenase subunit 6 [Iassus lateralis]WKW94153.1 NADH dehydrogenase subunit 6 [Iassus lateralis]WLN32158.1 NADH dehydrogenase subunit 6 [Iassus lateralis]
MKMLTMKIILITSSLIPFLLNPLSLSIMIIFKTLMVTLIMNNTSNSSWFPMMFFLMMVGGLLIIFSYMTSTVSNEKFKLNINLTLIIMLILIFPSDEMMKENYIYEKQNMISMDEMNLPSLTKMYNKKSMLMSILMIIYLLITMIMVSKLIMKNMGPLRSKN